MILMKKFLMPKYKMVRRVGRRRVGAARRRYRAATGLAFRSGRWIPRRRWRYNRTKKGFISLIRKLPAMELYSRPGVAGDISWNDPTPGRSCLAFGTPVAEVGVNGTYAVPFSMKFQLNQVINYTDMTSLVDQYKLVSAIVKINTNFMPAAQNLLATPYIEYYTDHDDAVVPSFSQVRETMGVRTKYFHQSRPVIGIGCRPQYRFEVRDADGATGFALGNRNWLNAAYSTVPHFAIKGMIRNVFLAGAAAPGGSQFGIDVSLKILGKDFQ